MRIITILNKCHHFTGFVYNKASYSDTSKNEIEVQICARKNSKGKCSNCFIPCPGYDKLPSRRYEFIPIWGFLVFLTYAKRRVKCPNCGIIAEYLPWAHGKNHLCNMYMQFLAHWAKKLSWKEVAISFGTSWDKVFRSVEYVVEWGLRHRNLDDITAIGVDEVNVGKGHKYLTLVYQINENCKRLLWVSKERTVPSFNGFFDFLGEEKTKKLEFVCSDMWKPYLKVIKERASNAINILDRFHIVARLNKALDVVRANEYRKMEEDGYEPVLKKSRWLLLKRPENLTENQDVSLKKLLQYNLKSVRGYLLKEDFQSFWDYISPHHAGIFLDKWINKVMRSRIEPLKKEAKTIKRHKDLILNWFRAKKAFSSGVVEGLNNKVKLTMRKSYGFRTYKCTEIALFHVLGKLPEPKTTHKFY